MAQRQRSVSTQIPSVRQDNSRPFLTQAALLNSLHAQQVFDRGYEMCANALFSLSVVLRFIGTEAQAQEVDEQNFFHATETGGTVVSSALVLMEEIIRARYPSSEWNIYGAQASDGDNLPMDNNNTINLLKTAILPLCQYYAYLEVRHGRDDDGWHRRIAGERTEASRLHGNTGRHRALARA